MYGIWAKPKYVFDQYKSELFGRFGWAHTKPEVTRAGFGSVSGSEDDFAWGIGANYRFNPNGYVGIDWMRYSNQSDGHVDGLTLSVGWHWYIGRCGRQRGRSRLPAASPAAAAT